jgi:hypothetical protein
MKVTSIEKYSSRKAAKAQRGEEAKGRRKISLLLFSSSPLCALAACVPFSAS